MNLLSIKIIHATKATKQQTIAVSDYVFDMSGHRFDREKFGVARAFGFQPEKAGIRCRIESAVRL